MLNGIEVLNKVKLMDTIYNKTWGNITSFFGHALVILFILMIIVLLIDKYTSIEIHLIGSIVRLLGIASIMLFLISCVAVVLTSKEIPNGKYQYQVTISDNVSMVEFNERYEVIKVQGKIYTIVEKEEK